MTKSNLISIPEFTDIAGIRENIKIAPFTWFRVGGSVRILFRPKSEEDLKKFLQINAKSKNKMDILPLGVGSNVLIRDKGINGIVIKLSSKFSEIKILDDGKIYAGASALMPTVALFARDHSQAGLEFLSGIPGTVGGGLRMNAGSYGSDHNSVIESVIAYTPQGERKELSLAQMGYSYRHTDIAKDWIFIGCIYKTTKGDKDVISKRIEEIKQARENSQPIRAKTGGSTFANPTGMSAWKLIDDVGMRGFKINDAQISEKHCNFLVNNGNATAKDLEDLGNQAKERIKEKFDIDLKWEIQILGIKGG